MLNRRSLDDYITGHDGDRPEEGSIDTRYPWAGYSERDNPSNGWDAPDRNEQMRERCPDCGADREDCTCALDEEWASERDDGTDDMDTCDRCQRVLPSEQIAAYAGDVFLCDECAAAGGDQPADPPMPDELLGIDLTGDQPQPLYGADLYDYPADDQAYDAGKGA